jgi:hypothetical protein
LQRRLGNRGVSATVRRLAAPDDRSTAESAPPQAVDPEQAKRLVEGSTEGLDAGTRDAAVEAAADPTVGRAPAGAGTARSHGLGPVSAESAVEGEGPQPTESRDEAEPDTEETAPDEAASVQTAPDEGAVEGGGGSGQPAQGEETAARATSESGAEQSQAQPAEETAAPSVPDTGAGALGTGDLVLIDVELAEHQRWAGAQGRVGAAASLERAGFVAEAAGGGFVSGVASGAAMGLGMGLAARFVPAIGPAIGAGMAVHGLLTRNWAETGATIGRFGEGNDTYEKLANSIAAVSAVVDTVSQVLTVINGIVGVVQIAAAVVAGGAVVAAIFTFGATLTVAAAAGEVVAACEEISLAITEVTTVLDGINSAILQPAVVLFRALHAFTAQADPREVEAQGQSISAAAETAGGALGGWLGGKAAQVGGGKATPPGEEPSPSKQPEPELPPPASGDGPTVHFEEPTLPAPAADAPLPAAGDGPAAHFEEPTTPAAQTEPGPPVPEPTAPAVVPEITATTSQPAPADTVVPPPTTPASATAPPASAEPPASPGSDLRPITAPLKLQAIKDSDAVPQGLAPGAIGTYGRAVADPHPAALASNPPGAPGATAGGGRMPDTGRRAAGVYLEHQTSAAVAHELLPGHEYHGPAGQERGGRDTQEALVIAMPQAAKGTKDAADMALLREVRARIAQGEDVPAIEGIARSAKITQDAIAATGAEVPGQQVSRNFLAEVDQFNDPRFGYQEVRPGQQLPEGHPLASPAELDAFLDRTFDPFMVPEPGSGTPPSTPPSAPLVLDPVAHPPSSDPGAQAVAMSAAALDMPELSVSSAATLPETSLAAAVSPSTAAVPPAAAPVSAEATPATPAASQDTPAPPSSGVSSKAAASSQRAPTAQHVASPAPVASRFTGDNQPGEGVERVNPQYPPPPATPAQIVAIQNQIINLLTVRATAEQEAQREGDRVNRCVANQGPIATTVADTAAGISAVQAHDAAVARREQLNAEQQQRQQESQKLTAGYPSRAAGFVALSVPLAVWERFTGLASHLPGEAGASMLRMNEEARKMQEAFAQMAAQMLGVDSAGPANAQQLESDQARLEATGEQAQSSDERLHTANAGAKGLQEANEAALAEAAERRDTATERTQVCADAATQREKQADTLAERLRAWAGLHAKARQRAIDETTERLRREGRTVLRSTER